MAKQGVEQVLRVMRGYAAGRALSVGLVARKAGLDVDAARAQLEAAVAQGLASKTKRGKADYYGLLAAGRCEGPRRASTDVVWSAAASADLAAALGYRVPA